jgi:hypothetical protein
MTPERFFPFLPNHSTWEDWNGNLIMWYGQEPIPANSELNWKETARSVSQLITFQPYPVPNPEDFGTWQEWALEFTQIINGPSH